MNTTQAMTESVERIERDANGTTTSRGVYPNADGTWMALTFTASKTFKTRAGAVRWLARRGVVVQ